MVTTFCTRSNPRKILSLIPGAVAADLQCPHAYLSHSISYCGVPLLVYLAFSPILSLISFYMKPGKD